MMEPVVIVGAGGFGREVHALIEDINRVVPTWEILGFADDDSAALDSFDRLDGVRWSIDELPVDGCRNYVCAVGLRLRRGRLWSGWPGRMWFGRRSFIRWRVSGRGA